MEFWPWWAVIWYTFMCTAGACNVLAFCIVFSRQTPSIDKQVRWYQWWMRWLAVPVVFVCTWRSVFPNLYPGRYTWYDTWLCSILFARMLATIAEIALVVQIALALTFIDRGVKTGGHF